MWLNNPRKPLEASGTSGMKASLNGVPHLSIGDGWWAEGYTGDNGWLIDAGDAGDPDAQDAADAGADLRPARDARSCRPSTTATTASRAAGCRSCATPSSASRRASARAAWSRSTWRRCTPATRSDSPQLHRRRANAASRAGVAVGVAELIQSLQMSRKSVAQVRCALCNAKDVSEPRGEERYCRDCWDKKIAVEEDRRARVRAEALHPRPQRREIPRSTTRP